MDEIKVAIEFGDKTIVAGDYVRVREKWSEIGEGVTGLFSGIDTNGYGACKAIHLNIRDNPYRRRIFLVDIADIELEE